MAATASGPPTVFPTVLYADARAAVRTLTEAFGFAPAAVHETADGRIAHAELSLGNGAVMIGPKGTGSAYDRAMAEGVEILVPPTDQEYGSRDYMARDAEGNIWSFGTYGPELPA